MLMKVYLGHNSLYEVSPNLNTFNKHLQSKTEAIDYVLYYEAKVPNSDRCKSKCQSYRAIKHQRHQYHTSAISNEICNLVLSQGAQKLPAIQV